MSVPDVRTGVFKPWEIGSTAASGVWQRACLESRKTACSCNCCFHREQRTRLDTAPVVASHASHVQTKRFFAVIEVVTQISMACMQAVDLVRDRQAIDLTGDLGPASKSMGLSGQLSPRSEQRQSFACSPCAASTDRRQACAHGRQIRIAFSPLRGRSSLLMPSKP
jgi:hypothetical protein